MSAHLSIFPNRSRIGSLLALLILGAIPSMGQSLVEQEVITGQADYGPGFAQSFLVLAGAEINAIELHIGSVGSGGGSAAIQLWEATGTPSSGDFLRKGNSPVATGQLDRENITDPPGFYAFPLDANYVNTSGAPIYLVFEVDLLTSGSDGYNNYSFTEQDDYADGHAVRWSGSRYNLRDGQDLTFRILGTVLPPPPPTPELSISVNPTRQLIIITVPNAIDGFLYTCYRTRDFRSRFKTGSTQRGNNLAINWKVQYPAEPPEREFYFVEVTRE